MIIHGSGICRMTNDHSLLCFCYTLAIKKREGVNMSEKNPLIEEALSIYIRGRKI